MKTNSTGLAVLYSSVEFWEERYAEEEDAFEWYLDVNPCLALLAPHVQPQSRVLIIGCGSSQLGMAMYAAGVRHVVNVDFSHVVIEKMKAKTPHCAGMQWLTLDVTDMSWGQGWSFDVVVDKGTWDAVAYSRDPSQAQRMLWQILKVLTIGGKYVLITTWGPAEFLPYANLFAAFWKVDHQRLGWYDFYTMTKHSHPSELELLCRAMEGANLQRPGRKGV